MKQITQDTKSVVSSDPSATEVQGVRQVIKIHENVVKVKSTQQAESSSAGSQWDKNAGNPSNPVGRVRKAAQVYEALINSKNTDEKGLKSVEPKSGHLNAGVRILNVSSSQTGQTGEKPTGDFLFKPDQVDFADVDHCLEMALLSSSKECNKQKDRYKALEVLSAAKIANPTSEALEIVYLLINNLNIKSSDRNYLIEDAVRTQKESYELWLLYITSREKTDDRLAAYNTALSALCDHASTSDDASSVSQCILDLFFQRMNFMCMLGNVGNAIKEISGLLLSNGRTDEPCQQTAPNFISYLTICDKFIFWTSSVYFVVYKKLPHSVVHGFGCWKESSLLEWPVVQLTFDEKQQARSLMKMAADSLILYMDPKSFENEKSARAAHLFAINHVQFVSIFEGLENSRPLLEKYAAMYPSCLELVLKAARGACQTGGLSFDGFEIALSQWPDEVPGIQCIWYHYAESVLQGGRFHLAPKLMDSWLLSVMKAQNLNLDALLYPALAVDMCFWFSVYSPIDQVFGAMNLSLFKALLNIQTDHALLAVGQALKASSADDCCRLLRELGMLLLIRKARHFGKADIKYISSILNDQMADGQAWLDAEPLSGVFTQKIRSPRVQELVRKMLRPVSTLFTSWE